MANETMKKMNNFEQDLAIVKQVIGEYTKIDQAKIKLESTLQGNLGVDSIGAVCIIFKLEHKLKSEIPFFGEIELADINEGDPIVENLVKAMQGVRQKFSWAFNK